MKNILIDLLQRTAPGRAALNICLRTLEREQNNENILEPEDVPSFLGILRDVSIDTARMCEVLMTQERNQNMDYADLRQRIDKFDRWLSEYLVECPRTRRMIRNELQGIIMEHDSGRILRGARR